MKLPVPHVTPVPDRVSSTAALLGPAIAQGGWPRISVVVPTYNQGRFIEDTLRSILRQGYPNLELIVCDGGSTDSTPDILAAYAPHITHIVSEKDRGQSDAINKGMRLATGDLLTWLNSDDLFADGALHKVAFAHRTTGADVIAGVCDVFGPENRTRHRHLPCLMDGPLPLDRLLDVEGSWLRGMFFHQPEVFFTRGIWERAGASVDESLHYSMDYDLWVRLAQAGARIAVIGSSLAHFRMHPEQKTSTPEAYKPELLAHARALRQRLDRPEPPPPAIVRRKLRVVLYNDVGFHYGAGIAHRRIAEAIASLGHEVIALAYADLGHRPAVAPSPAEIATRIVAERPDLVLLGNLHHITSDFDLFTPLLDAKLPVLFYAHDEWLLTGRCAYTGSCRQFLERCTESCPTAGDYPRLAPAAVGPAFAAKRAVLARAAAERLPFAVLTNSGHMQRLISDALPDGLRPPVHVLPIGIDTTAFTPGNRWRARELLDIPADRFVVLAAAADLTEARKGVSILLEALRSLPEPQDILLLMMGFARGMPEDLPIEVRFAGYIDDERIVALHHQAADIFVGPSLMEAFGQTFVEAAACGIPSVGFKVGGVPDAILDGVTGLLLERTGPQALASAIEALRRDPARRRVLGAQARLHAEHRFSRENCARVFLATLVHEPALAPLGVNPNVLLGPSAPGPIVLRYHDGRAELTRPAPGLVRWSSGAGMGERRGPPSPDLPERYWWATAPTSTLWVTVPAAGVYRFTVHCRSLEADQCVSVLANRAEVAPITLRRSGLKQRQYFSLTTSLSAGVNRIDLGFARWREEGGSGTRLALLVEAIDIEREGNVQDATPTPAAADPAGGPLPKVDGAWMLTEGAGILEGPYPELGLPDAFRWCVGPVSTLLVFSAKAARRRVVLLVRNVHPGQMVTVLSGRRPVLETPITSVNIAESVRLDFDLDLPLGTTTLRIRPAKRSQPDASGREVSIILEALILEEPSAEAVTSPEALGARTTVCWDRSRGLGPLEGPYPELDLSLPFRWITARECALVLEAQEDCDVTLRLDYRCHIPGQEALLCVNGTEPRPIGLRAGSISEPRSWTTPLRLRRGENVIEIRFRHTVQETSGGRELALLLEDVSIA